MNRLYNRNAFLRDHLLVLIGLCVCAYFSYHAFAGNRGMIRLYFVNQQIETLSKKEASLHQQAQQWSRKVGMMRPGSVDKDLLEERSRKVLGYRSADDVVVLSN